MDVLFLCTGNICRSPMAEALLRDRLARRGVEAHVHSAGELDDGRPASAHGVDVLRRRSIQLAAHRSRVVDAAMLDAADLVLGMAREHVRNAVVLSPSVWGRAFTLRELVRRGSQVGPRRPDQPLAEWLEKAHVGRSRTDLLGESREDDIDDPIGLSRGAYERTARTIEAAVDRLVDLLFPFAEEGTWR